MNERVTEQQGMAPVRVLVESAVGTVQTGKGPARSGTMEAFTPGEVGNWESRDVLGPGL